MDRTSASNFVDIGGGKRGYRDRNLAGGVAGTGLVAADRNAVQEEILGVIEGAGLTPDSADNGQLLKGLKKLGQVQAGNYAADTGTANAMVITLSPVPASLASLAGSPIRLKKSASANTSAVTLNVNGLGAAAVTLPDGSPISAGDLPANCVLNLTCTGTVFVLTAIPQRPVFAADTTASLAGSGWVRLPNGLIWQWASISVGSSGTTWTFPRSFPSALFAVFGTPSASGPTNDDVLWAGNSSASSCVFDFAATRIWSAFVQAIGA